MDILRRPYNIENMENVNKRNLRHVGEMLRMTEKGKLMYDKHGLSTKANITKTIEACTSPTKLAFSPPTTPSSQSSFIDTDAESPDQQSVENCYISEAKDSEKEVEDVSESDSSFSSEQYIPHMTLVERERHLQETRKTKIAEKRKQYEEFSKMLQENKNRQVAELEARMARKNNESLQKIEAHERERTQSLQQSQKRSKEHNIKHARRLSEKLKEAEEQKKRVEEETRKRREELRNTIAKSLAKSLGDIKDISEKATNLEKSCQFPEKAEERNERVNIIQKISKKAEELVKNTLNQENIDQNVIKNVHFLHEKANSIHHQLIQLIGEANKKGEEEEAVKKAAEEAEKQKQKAAAAAAKVKASAASSVAPNANEVLCVDQDAFVQYQKLQQTLEEVTKSYEALAKSTESQIKKFRFDLQKGINIPVNAISPTSGAHLRDKLQRICGLLSGQQVEVSGKHISAKAHPAGLNFCKDLFAKKIVKQGDEQVSSNYESAFAIAAVAVGVWCEYPEVGDLILAYFHQKSPYIVPYYVPKKEGQSSEEYYKSLGYNYVDGTVEKQDKFLKRMSGVIRLYAAMIISTPPRGQQQVHPHGIEHGWLWLTRILNLEPRPDVTATILYDFLQVTGNRLYQTYGKQFIKLMQIIIKEFVAKIKKVTPQGSGGPVTRLEAYLENAVKTGQFKPPEGVLPVNFWMS